ncbi:MAG: NfeD family protein [Anaerolineales bacterium]|jgi:membrane-bound serine protease (ClpP class)
MSILDTDLLPNLLYLVLVAGIWLAALAIVTPGTGVLEVLALAAFVLAGLGTLRLPLNGWALGLLVGGAIIFGVSVWKRSVLWLILAAAILSVASVFLFRLQDRSAPVNPLLAVVVSLLTLGFFWVVVRQGLLAHMRELAHDLSDLLNQVGEVRTAIDPMGSVYVAGELWTAKAESTIPAGSSVRVVGRDGLILVVEAVE